jgi:hypothetical protein
MEVLRRKTAPSPLILEFIESVLGICAVTVELAYGKNLVTGIGHKH